MPSSVDEDLEIGLHAPIIPPVFELIQQKEGVEFKIYDSEDALKEAITNGVQGAGVALPIDIMEMKSFSK
jgi:hypothetical protein